MSTFVFSSKYKGAEYRSLVVTGDDWLGLRQGNANDPFHLPDGFEAVISYEWQERSNHPFSHSYNAGKVFL
jgi:hypothetical protein